MNQRDRQNLDQWITRSDDREVVEEASFRCVCCGKKKPYDESVVTDTRGEYVCIDCEGEVEE